MSQVALVVLMVVLASCSRGDKNDDAVTTTTKAPTTTLAPSTTEPATGPVAPLTGLRVSDGSLLARPALAVKVDNLDNASQSAVPQAGLAEADLVYEVIVEGNITRFVAVFHSHAAGRVGPVRSARTTDLSLLQPFGKILFAWSGGNDGVRAAVRDAPHLLDVGHDNLPASYHRDSSRRAPHNLFVDADELWKSPKADGVAAPQPIFRYRTEGQAQPATAEAAAGIDLTWGAGGTPVAWRWDAKTQSYLRSQRGRAHNDAEGDRLTAKNVVVLVTAYGQSGADARSPEAITTGTGEAFVYTQGRVIHGRWGRLVPEAPASLFDSTGAPILLTPGRTWVELPRAGGVTTIR